MYIQSKAHEETSLPNDSSSWIWGNVPTPQHENTNCMFPYRSPLLTILANRLPRTAFATYVLTEAGLSCEKTHATAVQMSCYPRVSLNLHLSSIWQVVLRAEDEDSIEGKYFQDLHRDTRRNCREMTSIFAYYECWKWSHNRRGNSQKAVHWNCPWRVLQHIGNIFLNGASLTSRTWTEFIMDWELYRMRKPTSDHDRDPFFGFMKRQAPNNGGIKKLKYRNLAYPKRISRGML